MLTDPISMTGNGAAESFARVSTEGAKARYKVLARAANNECELTFSNQDAGTGKGRRVRTLQRLDDYITLSDGFTPGKNSISLIIDRPVEQAADTAVLELLAKLVNYLDVPANAQALIDGQI